MNQKCGLNLVKKIKHSWGEKWVLLYDTIVGGKWVLLHYTYQTAYHLCFSSDTELGELGFSLTFTQEVKELNEILFYCC